MKKLILILVAVLLSFATIYARTPRWVDINENVKIKNAKRLVINADLAAGVFRVISKDIEEAAIVKAEYDSRKIDAEVHYEEKGSTGYLELVSDNKRNYSIDTDDNSWDITLSRNYPTELSLDIGACEIEMELGGLKLSELNIDVGAASGTISFSKKNPIRLREIDIDAGACSLELISLGNANFDEFNFDGGVGSFEIDLRGKYNGISRVDLEIGLGSVEIILPKNVPVRIEVDGSNWLSSIDFHNEDLYEIEDDIYESPGFEDADDKIIIRLEIGLGSADLYWKR